VEQPKKIEIPDDQTKNLIAFTAQLLRTLQITIPLMVAS